MLKKLIYLQILSLVCINKFSSNIIQSTCILFLIFAEYQCRQITAIGDAVTICFDKHRLHFMIKMFNYSLIFRVTILIFIFSSNNFNGLYTWPYSASRVFFDLPRLVGKRKKTLLTASSIHIEHAPKPNVTKPCSASLSSCDNY